MSASPYPSNIRVSVTFKEEPVFAGEEVEATITFRNVDTSSKSPLSTNETPAGPKRPSAQPLSRQPSTHSRLPSLTSQAPSRTVPLDQSAHSRVGSVASQAAAPRIAPPQSTPHSRQPSLASQTPSQANTSRNPSVASSIPRAARRQHLGHRQTHSLNVLESSTAKQRGPPSSSAAAVAASQSKSHQHNRSVSIISLGSDADGSENKNRGAQGHRDSSRPRGQLNRSASLQVTPTSARSSWRSPLIGSARSPAPTPQAPGSAPLTGFPWSHPAESGRATSEGVVRPERSPSKDTTPRAASARLPQTFRFPPSPSPPRPSATDNDGVGPATAAANSFAQSNGIAKNSESHNSKSAPSGRVFSLTSDTGTPRSSSDVYSMSNNSDETMASEYASQQSSRLLGRLNLNRQPSQLGTSVRKRSPETLMMGFAQLSGSFTLDGSLVNQSPFDEVKRKAVVGGQGGGGVVGIQRPKAESGFFGGFSWGNIGESLGGLWGGSELSSVKEMKGIANSKDIPLLSTPKSILFVDLKLSPGDSRSYSYTFRLPRGLPPTHKGRAMKVVYHLVIGTQRPASGSSWSSRQKQQQHIRHIEVPLRVFGGVDHQGEALGHDLMSPYTVLKDDARTFVNDDSRKEANQSNTSISPNTTPQSSNSKLSLATPSSSESDFNAYITKLITTPRRNSSAGLISPTAEIQTPQSGRPNSRGKSDHFFPETSKMTMRSIIDHTIRLSTQPLNQSSSAPNTSQNQFTIARSGQPLARLTLLRPALRLGDQLHLVMDFARASTSSNDGLPTNPPPVHAITLTLESTESIDPTLAIRSSASVERATRKVWDRRVVGGSNGGALGWCRRWAGCLKVPGLGTSSASPGFETSGVGVRWCVRVEMVVGVQRGGGSRPGTGGGGGGGGGGGARDSGPEESKELLGEDAEAEDDDLHHDDGDGDGEGDDLRDLEEDANTPTGSQHTSDSSSPQPRSTADPQTRKNKPIRHARSKTVTPQSILEEQQQQQQRRRSHFYDETPTATTATDTTSATSPLEPFPSFPNTPAPSTGQPSSASTAAQPLPPQQRGDKTPTIRAPRPPPRKSQHSRGKKAALRAENLLDTALTDERGTLYVGRRALAVESFEVCVPLRVFGGGSGAGSGVDGTRGEVQGGQGWVI
ncbi:MAG: hypothetical protein M1831_002314 [Alyxoria varia]|nr:MAG: hypothetical protein M1831_002314 [Alyxoria varia]